MSMWLVKTEPESYSIADLERDGQTTWEGVRNYQARNALRDMRMGERVLVYHSNAEPPGIAGVAKVVAEATPDPTAWDPSSPYFDEGSPPSKPRWFWVSLGFVERFPRLIPLDELKGDPELAGLEVARRGSRLSVTPVTDAHYAHILSIARR